MEAQQLIYEQFKADILQWKNTHREEYGRFARLMAVGDEAQYLAICGAVFMQLGGIKREWELSWNDDSIENFENIFLRFNESSVPGQIVDMYNEQREEKDPAPATAPTSTWGRVKSFFSLKPKAEQITLSAPLVLSWLYYGKSFEALVSMLKKQSDRPEADEMDRQRCALVTKQIIDVSIKRGFRTKEDWNRHFAMDKAIKSGNIAEWALQSVFNDITAEDKKKSCDQQKGLAVHLNCDNKEAVIGVVLKFISKYGTAAEQVLTYYALSELGLLTGIDTAKDFAAALVAEFDGLGGMKSESSYRQAIHTLTTEQYVMKDGKYTKCVMLEGDACRTMLAEIKAGITEAMNGSSSNAADNPA